ncbi:ATP-binding protein [Rufibacter sp. XAAS-G3-1]|uniref:sensor histidine kinase n=1 Tax=Rufibacter sp. XAAS-G3-1 TaxID=2729134 RepID=UPI0015E64F45|nr:HAMP domain-containing sensor histidine kinase [Rufibacter sp. XAAS-G3-1]
MMPPEQTCEQQLEALRKEFEEFAYIVSHDLKAPLRAINNLSAWIGEDLGENQEPEVQNNLQLLQNRTQRMERMINGLLEYSRVSRQDLEVQEVSVEAMVQRLAGAFPQSQTLEVHPSHLPTFKTYAKKLETVFQQLLQNAVTFNEQETPEAWIEAQEQADAFVFKVRDNGIGIPAEAQPKVFNIFFTVQPKDRHETLGVGLAITRKIIQFVGGSISVQSTPGHGTDFMFTWPKTI